MMHIATRSRKLELKLCSVMLVLGMTSVMLHANEESKQYASDNIGQVNFDQLTTVDRQSRADYASKRMRWGNLDDAAIRSLETASSAKDLNDETKAKVLEYAQIPGAYSIYLIPKLMELGLIEKPEVLTAAEVRIIYWAAKSNGTVVTSNRDQAVSRLLAEANTFYGAVARKGAYPEENLWRALNELVLPIVIELKPTEAASVLCCALGDPRLYARSKEETSNASEWSVAPIVARLSAQGDSASRRILWDALQGVGNNGLRKALRRGGPRKPDIYSAVSTLASSWLYSKASTDSSADLALIQQLSKEWKEAAPENPGVTLEELSRNAQATAKGYAEELIQSNSPEPPSEVKNLSLPSPEELSKVIYFEQYTIMVKALDDFIADHKQK